MRGGVSRISWSSSDKQLKQGRFASDTSPGSSSAIGFLDLVRGLSRARQSWCDCVKRDAGFDNDNILRLQASSSPSLAGETRPCDKSVLERWRSLGLVSGASLRVDDLWWQGRKGGIILAPPLEE